MTIIFNKDNCCHFIAGAIFTPGLNEKEDNEFNILKKHPTFQELVENRVFKISKEKDIEALKDEIAIEINPRNKEEVKKNITINKKKGNIDLTQFNQEEK